MSKLVGVKDPPALETSVTSVLLKGLVDLRITQNSKILEKFPVQILGTKYKYYNFFQRRNKIKLEDLEHRKLRYKKKVIKNQKLK